MLVRSRARPRFSVESPTRAYTAGTSNWVEHDGLQA